VLGNPNQKVSLPTYSSSIINIILFQSISAGSNGLNEEFDFLEHKRSYSPLARARRSHGTINPSDVFPVQKRNGFGMLRPLGSCSRCQVAFSDLARVAAYINESHVSKLAQSTASWA
jgi:hypothetical protein